MPRAITIYGILSVQIADSLRALREKYGAFDTIRAEITGKPLPRAIDYWASPSHNGALPIRKDFDPMANPKLLPITFQLRKLWIGLEDIWNYRCNLSLNQKYNIVQKHKPQPFSKFKLLQTKYFFNQNKMLDKKKLQETILDDINIFLTSGINADFCNTGCLYVLTAISSVSYECLQAMPWLNQI